MTEYPVYVVTFEEARKADIDPNYAPKEIRDGSVHATCRVLAERMLAKMKRQGKYPRSAMIVSDAD
jgi:hypothetical protein